MLLSPSKNLCFPASYSFLVAVKTAVTTTSAFAGPGNALNTCPKLDALVLTSSSFLPKSEAPNASLNLLLPVAFLMLSDISWIDFLASCIFVLKEAISALIFTFKTLVAILSPLLHN